MRDYYFSRLAKQKQAKKDISKFYRKYKNSIMKSFNLAHFEKEYFDFYSHRSEENLKMIHELNSNDIEFDVKNYIHMFLNRLFDYNQNQREAVVYDLLIQSYRSLKHIEKNE
jgi:transposase InsO family protein